MLEKLITDGQELKDSVRLVDPGPREIRLARKYQSIKSSEYQDWVALVLRLIRSDYSSELSSVENYTKDISPDNPNKIMSTLKAIQLISKEPRNLITTQSTANNININNHQSNSQQVTLSIFIEAVKNELTDKQFSELKEIIEADKEEPEEMRSKMIEKIKLFTENTTSNILANILTNPTIYSSLI